MARWEKPDGPEPTDWRPYLEQVLEIDLSGYRDQTPRSAGTPPAEGVDPVDRRFFVGASTVLGLSIATPIASASGRQLGQSDIDRFAERLADLRRLDDYNGSAAIYPLVGAEVRDLAHLANTASYNEATARRLLSLLGEFYQFASWIAFDSGRPEQARKLAQAAAAAANQAGNRTLASTALSELSYITASSDQPRESVAMARASLANAPRDVLPAVEVVLADRLAWACARTEDSAGVQRALGISSDAHDRRNQKAVKEPDTVYWINRDESSIMAGRCWAEVKKPRKAVSVLESLTTPYDESHAREVALYQSWLASSYAGAGDLDRGVSSANKALVLSHSTASPRLNTLLDNMLGSFAPHAKAPQVRELLDNWSYSQGT
ncbi:MAG TPA: XRE family transcriptional regulator [Streptomyces sp.]